MAFIPVPDGIKVALEFTFGSRVVVVTLGFSKQGGAASGADLQTLNSDLQNWWHLRMAPVISGNVALAQIQSTALDTANSPQETLQINPADPGQFGTTALAANTALASTFYTATRGRNFRGRAYWPGIPNTQILDAQHALQAYVNTVATALTFLAGVGAGVNISHGVISRRLNKQPRPQGIVTAIDSAIVRTRLDSQRRRLGGVSK